MVKKKKSRKVGQIGTPSVPKEQRTPRPARSKTKKKTGNPAGSRHSAAKEDDIGHTHKKSDPRLGSKKPVPLKPQEHNKPAAKPVYFSPENELQAIENDPELTALLDRRERGEKLSAQQQAYLDQALARHQVLCDLLGIKDDAAQAQPDDPLDQFDAIDINKLNKQ